MIGIGGDDPSIEEVKIFAEQGNVNAQYKLGWAFFSGESVEEDADLALHWFRKAAMQGHPKKGLWRVGCNCLDEKLALIWYRKSAEAGYAFAQWWLGVKYQMGEGIKQDNQQALHWFQKAAEQDEAAACESLGQLYECGYCVEQNWQQSAYWYSKAARLSHKELMARTCGSWNKAR